MGETVRRRTRAILLLSFASLLLLIVVLGFGSYRRSDRIYRDVSSIHDAYRQRANVLSEIQSDLYRSGVLVRDHEVGQLRAEDRVLGRDVTGAADARQRGADHIAFNGPFHIGDLFRPFTDEADQDVNIVINIRDGIGDGFE